MKRFRPYVIPAFLVLLVFVVYANSLFNGFVSDDIPGIVQTGASWTWWSVFSGIRQTLHLTGFIQFLVYQCVGPVSWAYRLVNIICHAVSVLLVYAIVFQLVSQSHPVRVPDGTRLRQRWIAFIAASLFAVHPIIVESVVWISGGIYVHYSMVFLLSFWLYIQNRGRGIETRLHRYAKHCGQGMGQKTGDNEQVTMSRGQMGYYFASFFTYCVSLLFSEKAIPLFLVFFLYEFCFGNLQKNWRKLIPYVLVSIGILLFYMTKLGGRIEGVFADGGASGPTYYNPLIQLPIAITSYLELIVWPKNLAFYHSELFVQPVNFAIRSCITIAYISAIIWTALKKRPLCFFLVFFLIPLLPTLTPLKIAWLVAERYAYLSVIGIFVLIAYGFDWVLLCALRSYNKFYSYFSSLAKYSHSLHGSSSRSHVNPKKFFTLPARTIEIIVYFCLYGLILTSLSIRTVIRNQDWQSEDTLWIATAKTSPSAAFTWNNMGDVYSRHGDFRKAAEMFQRAIFLNGQYASAYHNLAESYRDMGEVGDAILTYEKALSLNPNLWQSHQSLAIIYYNKKDYQTALFHIEQALKIVPENQMLLQAREQLRTIQ